MAEKLSNLTVIEHIRYNDQCEEGGEGKKITHIKFNCVSIWIGSLNLNLNWQLRIPNDRVFS